MIPFSTTEQEVPGVTWIDGKQVFQITFNFGALPNATSKISAHGVADIDFIILHWAYAMDNDTGLTLPLPNVSNTLNPMIRFNVDRSNITCVTGTDRSAFETSAITWLYTKT